MNKALTITFSEEISDIKKIIAQLNSEEDWQADIIQFLQTWISEDTISVNTSGSTGTPKQILLHKSHMIASAMATIEHFNIPPNARALLCLPSKFIAGKMMLVRAMVGSWNLTLCKPSAQPIDQQTSTFDFVAMTPHQVLGSLDYVKAIHTLIIGGAPLPYSLEIKLKALKCNAFVTYGMTETITHVATRHIDALEYTALPGIKFWINDQECLTITAPHLNLKNMPTTDVVDLIDFTHFKWLGRLDNVVNSGGIKLFPQQIEIKLQQWLTREFYLLGIPDKILGEHLVMFIEGETLDPHSLNILWSELKQTLDKYELPKAIYFRHKFERTSNGKVKRILL